MTGEALKAQLLKIEPTLVAVAERLNISKQTLDSRLSASDVKTGFIEQLALIYNRPISFFFDESSAEVKKNTKRVKRTVNVDINGRIREILTKVFDNNAKVMAKATYVSQYTLNSIARGEFTPDYDTIRRIVEMSTPQINVDWLITGNGNMIDEPHEDKNEATIEELRKEIHYLKQILFEKERFISLLTNNDSTADSGQFKTAL